MFTISPVQMRSKILHIIDRATEQTKLARVKNKLLYNGIKSLDEGVVFLLIRTLIIFLLVAH